MHHSETNGSIGGGASDGSRENAAATISGVGFNAHSQVDARHTDDVYTFTKIAVQARVLYASWATTVLVKDSKVCSLGHQKLNGGQHLRTNSLRSGFGNHEKMLGCVSEGGLVAIAQSASADQEAVLSIAADDGPLLSHVAMAGNGKVAVTYKQAPNGRLCHVSEFQDETRFLHWLKDPSGEGNYPSRHHMLPGRPKQLLATSVSFLLLMEGGEVYSWGDARHGTLARSLSGEGARPADEPAAIESLGGLQIQKIACGGWMSAALSADGAAYVWGSKPPGAEHGIDMLQNRDASDVALVEIAADGGDPLDLIDVAVGDAHIAVVTHDKRLFVVGSNSNGQLGLGRGVTFTPGWQQTSNMTNVSSVACGPKTTFATTG